MPKTPFGFNLNGFGFVLNQFEEMTMPDEVVWVVGTDVEYAVYLEFGTSQHEPYPFLFPAAHDVMVNQAERIFRQSTDMEGFIGRLALQIEAQAKANASAAHGSKGRSEGTHPSHPKVQSGDLKESIEAERIA